nr:MAG TPA: hypothetical protein [Caudoviricetes sp.]
MNRPRGSLAPSPAAIYAAFLSFNSRLRAAIFVAKRMTWHHSSSNDL